MQIKRVVKDMNKNIIGLLILLIGIPVVIIMGVYVFSDRQYAFISLAIAVLSFVPFFMAYENNKETNSKRLILLSVLIALSVLGRFVFAFIPFFKPVTAIVIITGLYFGPQMGFMAGAFSALISNFYFGQGPWTVFQMFAWGLIGLIAGLLPQKFSRNIIALVLLGLFSGIIFSAVMDVWSVIWVDEGFNLSRYVALFVAALPAMLTYTLSNIVFLLIASKPIGRKLDRIKHKYGV